MHNFTYKWTCVNIPPKSNPILPIVIKLWFKRETNSRVKKKIYKVEVKKPALYTGVIPSIKEILFTTQNTINSQLFLHIVFINCSGYNLHT